MATSFYNKIYKYSWVSRDLLAFSWVKCKSGHSHQIKLNVRGVY